jgi:DNA-binding beta-propeller fold protein YncE
MAVVRQIGIIAFISLLFATSSAAYQQVEFVREIGAAGKKARDQRILSSPLSVAVAGDRLYVADTDAHRVIVLDRSGKIIHSWGAKGNKPGQFKSPAGIAVDERGRVFVADTGNHRIQVFDGEGKLLRAFGAKGDGPGEFDSPSGIAASRGLVYVADTDNSRMQVLTGDGIFLNEFTVKLENDEMKEPIGVAVDAQNRIYVLDRSRDAVRIFSPDGVQMRMFGARGSGSEGFDKPGGIALDRQGNIYVADTGNHMFKKFDPRGRLLGSAGCRGDGPGQFREPRGIVVDRENTISVLDAEKNTLQMFSSERGDDKPLFPSSPLPSLEFFREFPGEAAALAIKDKRVWAISGNAVMELSDAPQPKFGASGSKEGLLKNPHGFAFDESGSFWIADTDNDRIQKFNPDGSFAQAVGTGGSREGEFDSPSGIAVSTKGKIFVADTDNKRVQVFSATGVFLGAFGKGGKNSGQFSEPVDVAVDKMENVYVADRGNERIAKYDSNGKLLWETGRSGKGDGEFKSPENIIVTPDNEVLVLDAGNSRVQVFDADGKFLRKFGSEGKGPGEFRSPRGMALQDGIRLYVGDRGNARVQAFTLRHTPAVPKDVTTKERPHEIRLGWKANIETYFDHYDVYRLDPDASEFVLVATTKDPFYVDRNLPSNKSYLYQISSRAIEGNESGPSATITAATPKLVPAEPSKVSVEAREKQATLSWRPNSEPYLAHYTIYRKKKAADKFEFLATCDKNVYVDRPLEDETEYSYKIAAVGNEGDESPGSEVTATTPKALLTAPPLEIDKIEMGEIFAAAYKYYEAHPLGKIVIVNNTDQTYAKVKLSFSIKDFMDFPTEIEMTDIAPKQSVELQLKPVFSNKILEVNENTPLQSELKLTYYEGGEPKTVTRSFPVTLYERHAIRWDQKAKVGSFVTFKDQVVTDFTRAAVQPYVDECPNLHQSIVYARAIYESLGVMGVAYLVDPTPYAEFSANSTIVDYTLYPRDILAQKSGDCDGLSTLFAAAAENIGIETAFIDVPGHVFVMFNTGVSEKERGTLGFPDDVLVLHQGTAWIPLEMTLVGSSFTEAWKKGAEEYRDWTAKGKADIVSVHKAWEQFKPVTLPPADFKPLKVTSEEIEAKYKDELETLAGQRLTHLSAEYREKLVKKPGDPDALTQLGILYGEYGLYAEALDQFDKILANDAGNAAAHNNIGNIRFVQGKYDEALQAYTASLQADPGDPGIMVNLARSLQKLKKTDEAKKRLQDAAAIDPRVVRQYSDIASSLGVK